MNVAHLVVVLDVNVEVAVLVFSNLLVFVAQEADYFFAGLNFDSGQLVGEASLLGISEDELALDVV